MDYLASGFGLKVGSVARSLAPSLSLSLSLSLTPPPRWAELRAEAEVIEQMSSSGSSSSSDSASGDDSSSSDGEHDAQLPPPPLPPPPPHHHQHHHHAQASPSRNPPLVNGAPDRQQGTNQLMSTLRESDVWRAGCAVHVYFVRCPT